MAPRNTTNQNEELINLLIESNNKNSSDAITTTGIRNWWAVIAFCIMGSISIGGWLVSKTVDGTKELTSMQSRLSALEQKTLQVDVVKNDQQKLSVDVKDLQVSVVNINKSLDIISMDLKVVAGQMQQVSNAIQRQETKK